MQHVLLDGRQDRLVRPRDRKDEAAGTDRIPAQVVVAAEVRVGPPTGRRPAMHDEAAAAAPTLGEARQQVLRLDPIGRSAPELAVGGAQVGRPRVAEARAYRLHSGSGTIRKAGTSS